MTKSIFLSKTAWVAVIYFLLGGFMALHTQYPYIGWITMGKAILDICLRLSTNSPVNLTGSNE